MSDHTPQRVPTEDRPTAGAIVRGLIGGTFMGLANLVPGISGGTMLVATGVYTRFIDAIADLSTLKFRLGSIVTLVCIVGSALAAIVLLAGLMVSLVSNHPMVMFSLFIGLTLGGVPLIWRMLGTATIGAWIAAAVMFAVMAALAWVQSFGEGGGTSQSGAGFMFLAGVVAAGAMILPGVSGGYMFLLLGVYVPVLKGIDALKQAAGERDWAAIQEPLLGVALPIGAGVVIGVVGVSNVLKLLLRRFPKPTLGALLGLLVGAVAGLWPFQQAVPVEEIALVKNQPVTVQDGALAYERTGEAVEADDYPSRPRAPRGIGEAASSAGLIAAGFIVTAALARLGREKQAGAIDEAPDAP